MTEGLSGMDLTTLTATDGKVVLLEHQYQRGLTGNPAAVRARLVKALARLGYFVQSEAPLIAKRAAQLPEDIQPLITGAALPHVVRLTIHLEPLNANATLARFDYGIRNSIMQGDRQTLEREADAIIAVAQAQHEALQCLVCGYQAVTSSRFCRACGAPQAAHDPAELEVLRLTAQTRAAYHSIAGGVIAMTIWAALILPLMYFSRKGPLAGAVFLACGEFLSAGFVLWGMRLLHRALNPAQTERQPALVSAKPALPSQPLLPAAPPSISVTEHTTRSLEER